MKNTLNNKRKEDVLREFENSKECDSFVDIDIIEIFKENHQIWIIAEDLHYDVGDPESTRTFSVNYCRHTNGERGYSFEES